MARRTRTRALKRTGCLFWIFILLIIVVIFLYRGKGSFKETIDSIVNITKGEKKEEITSQKKIPGEKKSIPSEEKITVLKPDLEKEQTGEMPGGKEESSQEEPAEKKEITLKEETATGGKLETTPSTTEIKKKISPVLDKEGEIIVKKETTEQTIKFNTRTSIIYYAFVDLNTGKISLTGIKKSVKYVDSPITKTIQLLLKGPGEGEKKKGFKTFIPEGTRLLSASLKNNHLTLNFNENFENNYLGRKAIELQLKQILLTCFEFDEVKSVSILINGKQKRYITGEGILLKQKYTRSDLSTL